VLAILTGIVKYYSRRLSKTRTALMVEGGKMNEDIKNLTVNQYQAASAGSDKTSAGKGKKSLHVTILGLVGETGSLLSEVKKGDRDVISQEAQRASVVEELGDCLWYISAVARYAGILLSDVNAASDGADYGGAKASPNVEFRSLQPQIALPMYAPATFERTLLGLSGAVGELATRYINESLSSDRTALTVQLGIIFGYLKQASTLASVTLAEAAAQNLAKTADRWPSNRVYPQLADEDLPQEEQLPRNLGIEIFEREVNGKTYVLQRCNDIFIGDRLTDNIMVRDDYRFHDVFHYAYATKLGWSPVMRALFRLKRKSIPAVDEGEDGARAALIEEGVAAYVFGVAKDMKHFVSREPGELSFSFLKSIRQFVKGYEVERAPLWLWEEAILSGYEAFRFLVENRRGLVTMDLINRSLKVTELKNDA
jgi:NTP pyrophosphatase (non-canonical NTP hydrolase)